MSLTDLLKEAQQRKQELDRIEEQKKLAEKAELDAKLAIEKAEFEALLKKDAGDIFDHLDEPPTIRVFLNGNSTLQANVFHRVLVVSVLEIHKTWSVTDRLSEKYQQKRGGRFSDKSTDVFCDKLSDYLLVRFLEIAKEHDRLLAVIEEENIKKAREAELDAKERQANARLELFAKALRALGENQNKQVDALIEAQSKGLWTWPKDFVLDLYKVSWCTGAYRGEYWEETEFDYESGWSLNDDVLVGEPEWFVLLPEFNKPARTLKTSGTMTVERFSFTEETLPDCLFDHPQKFDIEIADIEFTVGHWKERFRLLPESIPPSPEGCEVSIKKQIMQVDLRALPITEIQQAINKLSAPPTGCIEDSSNDLPF